MSVLLVRGGGRELSSERGNSVRDEEVDAGREGVDKKERWPRRQSGGGGARARVRGAAACK
eukprot:4166688-Pleurochrysis_carterae.AAC.2